MHRVRAFAIGPDPHLAGFIQQRSAVRSEPAKFLLATIARCRDYGVLHFLATCILDVFFGPEIRVIHIEGEHQRVVVEMIRRRILQQRNRFFSRCKQLGDVGFVGIGRLLPQRDHRPVWRVQRDLRRNSLSQANGDHCQHQ
jgi:hypothetical protein